MPGASSERGEREDRKVCRADIHFFVDKSRHHLRKSLFVIQIHPKTTIPFLFYSQFALQKQHDYILSDHDDFP